MYIIPKMKTLLFVVLLASAALGQDRKPLECGQVETKTVSGPPSEYKPSAKKPTVKKAPKKKA